MLRCFMFEESTVRLLDEQMTTIAVLSPYGFIDSDTGEPLDICFSRGEALADIVEENRERLSYEPVDGIRTGCAIVPWDNSRSFVMTLADEDDGEVLVVEICESGDDVYDVFIYEGDGMVSEFMLCRKVGGFHILPR